VRDRWNLIARGPAVGDNHSGPVRIGTQLVDWNGTETGGIASASATNRWSTLPPAPLARSGRWGGGDGLDRPRGGHLERLEHRGSIAAVPRWAATARSPAPERDRSGPAGHLGARPGPGDRGTVGPAGAEPQLQQL
jgi:hypothetical protein